MIDHQATQRISAGHSGVYDAVFSEDSQAWFIRMTPYGVFGEHYPMYSQESYDRAADAHRAWHNDTIAYRYLEAVSAAGYAKDTTEPLTTAQDRGE